MTLPFETGNGRRGNGNVAADGTEEGVGEDELTTGIIGMFNDGTVVGMIMVRYGSGQSILSLSVLVLQLSCVCFSCNECA